MALNRKIFCSLLFSSILSILTDINECERPANCQRGRCINSMGSYHCECQKGYMLIGGRRCQGR